MPMVVTHLFGPPTVEREFYELPNVQRDAVMAHETGHKVGRHLWRRLFLQFVLTDSEYSALMHAQEYEADAYAKALGHGSALVNVLRRAPEPASRSHPSTKDRIARLML